MAHNTQDRYKIVQFTDQEDLWMRDGLSEFVGQVNKEGDDGWELEKVVDLNGFGFAAVLRRDGDYYRQD